MRWSIFQASHVLKAGGIIAYPTESVWGIGCDPSCHEALESIIRCKRRERHKGLILVAASLNQIDFLTEDLSAKHMQQLSDSWPGPITWLLPHKNRVHPLVHGRFSTVAVRVSDHPIIQQLCTEFDGPIISTSANFSGRNPARSSIHIRKQMGKLVDFIVPGALGGNKTTSKIIDLISGRIIRG